MTAASIAADSHTYIRPSEYIIHETPKSEPARDDDDDDYEDEFLQADAKKFGRENLTSVTSPYIMPYFYKRRFLCTQYGIRKDCDTYKIDDSVVVRDTDGDIINQKEFRCSEDLWEFLTRKNVNNHHVTSEDLRRYKKIILMTNAHLEGYQTGGVINVTGGKSPVKSSPSFRKVQMQGCWISVRSRTEKILT